jgi:hypothetical protein
MPCSLASKTANLSVLENLLHRFDRAFHGCSQHRNRFGHRLQYCKTINPGAQVSFGSHFYLFQCDLDDGRQRWHYRWWWEGVKRRSSLRSLIVRQAQSTAFGTAHLPKLKLEQLYSENMYENPANYNLGPLRPFCISKKYVLE